MVAAYGKSKYEICGPGAALKAVCLLLQSVCFQPSGNIIQGQKVSARCGTIRINNVA